MPGLPTDAVRMTILRYRMIETGVSIALMAGVFILVHQLFNLDIRNYMFIPWFIIWTIAIVTGNYNEGRNEYWVQTAFLANLEQALAEAGFYKVVSDNDKVLYEKKYRFRKEFATMQMTGERITLDIAASYEKTFDKHVRPHMLDGGGRYYKRLFPKAWQREKRASAV